MAARMTTNHSGTIHCGIIEQRSLGTADSNRGDDSQILDREPNKQPSRLRASEGVDQALLMRISMLELVKGLSGFWIWTKL